jgi:hypothetical protein
MGWGEEQAGRQEPGYERASVPMRKELAAREQEAKAVDF